MGLFDWFSDFTSFSGGVWSADQGCDFANDFEVNPANGLPMPVSNPLERLLYFVTCPLTGDCSKGRIESSSASNHPKPSVSYKHFAAAGILLSNPILHKSARF